MKHKPDYRRELYNTFYNYIHDNKELFDGWNPNGAGLPSQEQIAVVFNERLENLGDLNSDIEVDERQIAYTDINGSKKRISKRTENWFTQKTISRFIRLQGYIATENSKRSNTLDLIALVLEFLGFEEFKLRVYNEYLRLEELLRDIQSAHVKYSFKKKRTNPLLIVLRVGGLFIIIVFIYSPTQSPRNESVLNTSIFPVTSQQDIEFPERGNTPVKKKTESKREEHPNKTKLKKTSNITIYGQDWLYPQLGDRIKDQLLQRGKLLGSVNIYPSEEPWQITSFKGKDYYQLNPGKLIIEVNGIVCHGTEMLTKGLTNIDLVSMSRLKVEIFNEAIESQFDAIINQIHKCLD